jgi:hypothetical protein
MLPMSTPNPAQIYIALRNRLQSMHAAPVIVEPGQDYPSNPSVPFVLIQDERLDNPRRYASAAAKERQRGIFALAIMTPLEWSHPQVLGLSGAVAARFPKGLVLPVAGGNPIRMEKQAQVINGAYRDGAFLRQPVHVYWYVSA